jgi:hypothetical protein
MRFSFKSFLAAVVAVTSFASVSTSHAWVTYSQNGQQYGVPIVRDIVFSNGLDDAQFKLSAPMPEEFYLVFELSRDIARDAFLSEGLLTTAGETAPVYKNFNQRLTKGFGKYRVSAAVCAKKTQSRYEIFHGINTSSCGKPYYETFDYYRTSNHVSSVDAAANGLVNNTVNVYTNGNYTAQTANSSYATSAGCRSTTLTGYSYGCRNMNGVRIGTVAQTSLTPKVSGSRTYANQYKPSTNTSYTPAQYYTPGTYATKYKAARPFSFQTQTNNSAFATQTASNDYYTQSMLEEKYGFMVNNNGVTMDRPDLPLYANITDRDAFYESMYAPKKDYGSSTTPFSTNYGATVYTALPPANGYTSQTYGFTPASNAYTGATNSFRTVATPGTVYGSKYNYLGQNWHGYTGVKY